MMEKKFIILVCIYLYIYLDEQYLLLDEPPPHIDGIRINSPHYLCKIKIDVPGTHKYTLVVSQYEKHKNIHFTIRSYSVLPVKMFKIQDSIKKKKRVSLLDLILQTLNSSANSRPFPFQFQ